MEAGRAEERNGRGERTGRLSIDDKIRNGTYLGSSTAWTTVSRGSG
jgi:hypothetical protein